MVNLFHIFLTVFVMVMILGLIPSVVSEEWLHNFITRIYLSDKSNLDRIYEELDSKSYLVEDYFVMDYKSLTNCHSVYYFVEPVTVTFDIDSVYKGGTVSKEYHDVVVLTLFLVDGDIECQVGNRDNNFSKSVFIFDDTHKLEFSISSED